MNRSTKRQSALTIIVVAVAISALALGLPKLGLRPGMPLPEMLGTEGAPRAQAQDQGSEGALDGSLALGSAIPPALGFLLLLILSIKKTEGGTLRALLFSALRIVLAACLLCCALWFLLPREGVGAAPGPPAESPRELARSPLGSASPYVYWLLAIILTSIALVLIYRALSKKPRLEASAFYLRLEAQKAKDALLEGRELKSVVLECYRRMCAVLRRERRLEREEAMTASEFALALEAAGAPGESVGELTRLFEAARYGTWAPRPEDEARVLRCLDDVLRFSRDSGQGDRA